jgi:hypothetical protein
MEQAEEEEEEQKQLPNEVSGESPRKKPAAGKVLSLRVRVV